MSDGITAYNRRVRRNIGIFFWTTAAICASISLYGAATNSSRHLLAGLIGAAWFTLCATAPRNLFVKSCEETEQ